MKIYKIRAWVNGKRKRNGVLPPHPYFYEEVIINNLETAKMRFDSQKTHVKNHNGLSYCVSGFCELFIPHLFKDGSLAYWPDNNEYIDKYSWE